MQYISKHFFTFFMLLSSTLYGAASVRTAPPVAAPIPAQPSAWRDMPEYVVIPSMEQEAEQLNSSDDKAVPESESLAEPLSSPEPTPSYDDDEDDDDYEPSDEEMASVFNALRNVFTFVDDTEDGRFGGGLIGE